MVWDWNGTLLDDFHLVVDAASAACSTVGRGPVTPEEYRTCFVRPIERSYERLLGRPLGEGEWERLTAAFHSHYARALPGASLVSDARPALATVATAGLSQSLLSMWTHEELVPLVEAFGIAPWFARIDGQPTFGGGRKEAHLRRHLDLLARSGEEVLVVGDSVDDAHAAEAVGAGCVLVDSGPHHPDSLQGLGVPVVGSISEALRVAGVGTVGVDDRGVDDRGVAGGGVGRSGLDASGTGPGESQAAGG